MRCRCCRDTTGAEESPPEDLDIGLGIQQETSNAKELPEEESEEEEGAVGGVVEPRNGSKILEEDMDLQGIVAVMPLSPSTETSEGIGGDDRPLVKVKDK